MAWLPQGVIAATPRTAVVEQAGGDLHAIATRAFFGFVDDLELYADADEPQFGLCHRPAEAEQLLGRHVVFGV